MHYPMPAFFKEVMEKIAEEFAAAHPGLTVRYLAPAPNYEDAVQQILWQGVAGGLPDVSFQGLNRLRMIQERRLPVDLRPFLMRDGAPAPRGWTPNLLGLGQVRDAQVGMAFASSNPVVYYNANLVRRAGGDPARLPTDWNALIALAGRIHALGADEEAACISGAAMIGASADDRAPLADARQRLHRYARLSKTRLNRPRHVGRAAGAGPLQRSALCPTDGGPAGVCTSKPCRARDSPPP